MFVNNTGCLNLSCLYALSPEEVTQHVPWHVYPYWAMSDQLDLPEKGHFDGALPVIDGKNSSFKNSKSSKLISLIHLI